MEAAQTLSWGLPSKVTGQQKMIWSSQAAIAISLLALICVTFWVTARRTYPRLMTEKPTWTRMMRLTTKAWVKDPTHLRLHLHRLQKARLL